MSFLYPFLNFLQPGIVWPDLQSFRPMLVVSMIALIIGTVRLRRSSTKIAFSHPSFVWMVVFIAVQIVSVYSGGGTALLDEFMFWLVYLLFVVVSLMLLADTGDLRRYIWGMLVAGMFITGFGIYAVSAGIGLGVTGRAGAYGMYQNHNDYSFIIIQIFPFIYCYMRAETTRFRRMLLAASLVICVVGVFMSMSRGAVIVLVLEVVMIIVYAMQGRRRWFLLPVIALLGTGAVIYQFQQRAENQGERYTAADAESSRDELIRAGMVMFKQHPLLGVGSRRFGELAREYYDLSGSQIGKNSHNTFVEVLSTTGLMGFVPFVLMIYYIVRDLRRLGKGGRNPILDATLVATFIALVAIACRSYLDAKVHDWSFYTLIAIGLCCYALRKRDDAMAAAETTPGRS